MTQFDKICLYLFGFCAILSPILWLTKSLPVPDYAGVIYGMILANFLNLLIQSISSQTK